MESVHLLDSEFSGLFGGLKAQLGMFTFQTPSPGSRETEEVAATRRPGERSLGEQGEGLLRLKCREHSTVTHHR